MPHVSLTLGGNIQFKIINAKTDNYWLTSVYIAIFRCIKHLLLQWGLIFALVVVVVVFSCKVLYTEMNL